MNMQAVAFLGLVVNQLLATATFIAIYGRSGSWHSSAVGRHLMFWAIASAALDASWVLLLVAQWPWLIYVLFGVQAVLGVLTWQRTALAWRARHHRR